MSAVEAARLSDELGHTCASLGFWIGAIAGAALGAILVVATGGTALILIGAVMAGAGAGALGGMYIGQGEPSDPKGPIITGSPNVFIGQDRQRAGRAGIDKVACLDHGEKLLAEGSKTVVINNALAARKTDRTQCDGKLREGWPTVIFGGDAQVVVDIEPEVPDWLVNVAVGLAIVGAIIATGGAILAGASIGATLAGVVGGYVVGEIGARVGGDIGERLGGERGRRIGEVGGGFLGSLFGGAAGGRAYGRALANPRVGPRLIRAERALVRPVLRASPRLRASVARSRGSSPVQTEARRQIALERVRAYRAAGRPASDQAARSVGWQNKGRQNARGYGGVDPLENTTLQPGQRVVIGKGGAPSGYAVPEAQYNAFRARGGNIDDFWQGIQVGGNPGRATPGNPNGYRTQVEIYEITSPIPAAQGGAVANPKYGAGGLQQIYADGLGGTNLPANARLIRTDTLPTSTGGAYTGTPAGRQLGGVNVPGPSAGVVPGAAGGAAGSTDNGGNKPGP